MANATNEASLPTMVDIDVFGTAKSNTGWDTIAIDGSYILRALKTSDNVQNDEITWDVLLKKGTWTIEIMNQKSSDVGIYSVQIDTVEEGTIDGYNSTSQVNILSSVSGVAITNTGIHELKFKMATKNGSSSGYRGNINAIRLIRTGA